MKNDYKLNIEGLDLLIEYDKKDVKKDQVDRIQAYEIKAVREKTGMNRKDFANWLGIPYRTISDWEHGERKMPDYVLRLIAYKVKMEYVEKR
ncbi:helix-turn-helix domain-containing protein [Butyrivibrio sp.]|uniref:helix-turn-helix domain-containing protein n=1 Tax=Butyrivibrio sp. TaxID=28121 RepID=UPI002ED239E0